ncbi:hypothetical protein AGMMS50262_13050 [Bacteroidia bacterium]|nr:hypothetical protein AGMMS50262_13050 [Bacteroidia bacterium]
MKKVRFSTTVAIAAIALSIVTISCNTNVEPEMDDSKVELRLASGVEVQKAPQLRAAFAGSNTQIPNGQTVHVWVDETGGSQMYANNTLTATGGGGFTGGTSMFFPQSGGNVDIYAVHTNAVLTSYPTAALTHTVSTDQTALPGYAPSDLLYAKKTNVARTTAAVQLTFYHLLSKLQVAIVLGNGLAPADIAGVTIGGTKLSADFTLAKATAPDAIAITASGTDGDITIGADISTNFAGGIQYNDVIIVPQTVAEGTAFITVHLVAGGDLVYKIPAGGITFESSKKYEYQITANLTGLTLTSTITNWTAVNAIPGTAEM